MKTYTLMTDHPKHGKAGAQVSLHPNAAKYLVLDGVLAEAPAPKVKAAAAAEAEADKPASRKR